MCVCVRVCVCVCVCVCTCVCVCVCVCLLPTGSEERKVLGVGSIPVAILVNISNYCIIIT